MFLPLTNRVNLQDLIFLLVDAGNQNEEYVWKMPFHHAYIRYRQIKKKNDEEKRQLEEQKQQTGRSSHRRL